MRLTVVWRPDSVGARDGTETTVETNTVVQVRTAGASTREEAMHMKRAVQEVFWR